MNLIGYVSAFVDRYSFKNFLDGEEFYAWDKIGEEESINIIIPSSSILAYKDMGNKEIRFLIKKRELWK